MEYGKRKLKRERGGPDVAELQLRLAGFRATMPDGEFWINGVGASIVAAGWRRKVTP